MLRVVWACVTIVGLVRLAPAAQDDTQIFASPDADSPVQAPASAEKKALPAAAHGEDNKTEATQKPTAPMDDGRPQVRLVGVKTDVAKRYRWIVPPFPIPPFTRWRQWYRDHENAVHCALEWRDENGNWFRGEMRSTHYDQNTEQYRVGYGEFPGTAYDAYGVFIMPGRLPRDKDSNGRPLDVVLDEELKCDYRQLEREIRKYASKDARPGDPGTGGKGRENVGLGGPAYKPAQNSNTMVNYVLRKCNLTRKAPDLAVGWDREPEFPYSSDAEMPPLDK